MRSSLVVPPQIPSGMVRSAYERQFRLTEQRPQTAFAELICCIARPCTEIGKNSSGIRAAARTAHHPVRGILVSVFWHDQIPLVSGGSSKLLDDGGIVEDIGTSGDR